MRYGLYARKSTEEDERQAQSIEKQLDLTHTLANREQIDLVIITESRSAKEPGRPEFNRMLQMVDAGEIQGIIALHPDRLARNEMDAAAITWRLRKGVLKDLLFVNYFFHNSPEGIMMLQIALSQSQYMVSKLAKDVTDGMESKIRKGWFPHHAPPGYVNDKHMDQGERTISPDPERFPLIRKAFDYLLSEGYLPVEVLRLLNEEWGYRTPLTRKTGGDPMSKTVFYRMLGNIFYTGAFYHKGTLFPGKHLPMLTMEEFRRLQALLKRTGRVQRKVHVFEYTGMIRCAHCHHLITAQVNQNRYGREYSYYRCTRCRGQNISAAKLQTLLDAEIELIALHEPHFRQWAEEAVADWQKRDRNTDQVVYERKLSSLAEVDRRLDALLAALTKGLIVEEEYRTHKARLQEERVLLHQETEAVEQNADRARQAMENTLTFLTHVQEWMTFGDVATKRACVRAMGSNFFLEGQKLVLEPHPLLLRIREDYKSLQAKYQAIQLSKRGSESTKKDDLASIRSEWCSIWDYNQTLAYEEGVAFSNLKKIIEGQIRKKEFGQMQLF